MPNIGYVAVVLALVLSVYAAVVAVVGAQRRIPNW
jgi:cytochrome c biogenesis factor